MRNKIDLFYDVFPNAALICYFFCFSIAKRFIHLLYSNFSAKWRNHTVGDLFLKTASRLPDKVNIKNVVDTWIQWLLINNLQTMMVLCQEQGDVSMTYKECRILSSQIARYFLEKGYKKVRKIPIILMSCYNLLCDWLNYLWLRVMLLVWWWRTDWSTRVTGWVCHTLVSFLHWSIAISGRGLNFFTS